MKKVILYLCVELLSIMTTLGDPTTEVDHLDASVWASAHFVAAVLGSARGPVCLISACRYEPTSTEQVGCVPLGIVQLDQSVGTVRNEPPIGEIPGPVRKACNVGFRPELREKGIKEAGGTVEVYRQWLAQRVPFESECFDNPSFIGWIKACTWVSRMVWVIRDMIDADRIDQRNSQVPNGTSDSLKDESAVVKRSSSELIAMYDRIRVSEGNEKFLRFLEGALESVGTQLYSWIRLTLEGTTGNGTESEKDEDEDTSPQGKGESPLLGSQDPVSEKSVPRNGETSIGESGLSTTSSDSLVSKETEELSAVGSTGGDPEDENLHEGGSGFSEELSLKGKGGPSLPKDDVLPSEKEKGIQTRPVMSKAGEGNGSDASLRSRSLGDLVLETGGSDAEIRSHKGLNAQDGATPDSPEVEGKRMSRSTDATTGNSLVPHTVASGVAANETESETGFGNSTDSKDWPNWIISELVRREVANETDEFFPLSEEESVMFWDFVKDLNDTDLDEDGVVDVATIIAVRSLIQEIKERRSNDYRFRLIIVCTSAIACLSSLLIIARISWTLSKLVRDGARRWSEQKARWRDQKRVARENEAVCQLRKLLRLDHDEESGIIKRRVVAGNDAQARDRVRSESARRGANNVYVYSAPSYVVPLGPNGCRPGRCISNDPNSCECTQKAASSWSKREVVEGSLEASGLKGSEKGLADSLKWYPSVKRIVRDLDGGSSRIGSERPRETTYPSLVGLEEGRDVDLPPPAYPGIGEVRLMERSSVAGTKSPNPEKWAMVMNRLGEPLSDEERDFIRNAKSIE